jgi:hypothetical protein
VTTISATGAASATATKGTLSLSSPLRATSAGGGNPALNRAGYAGYLVLENFDPAAENINGDAAELLGGTEHAVGDADDSDDIDYAYLRLATATGTETLGTRESTSMTGWAAGLGQVDSAAGLVVAQVDSGESANGLKVATNATTNRAAVELGLLGLDAATANVALGGLTSNRDASAFIDNERYAARSTGETTDLGFITSGLIAPALSTGPTSQIEDSDHYQWGFFFGDFATGSGAQRREHHVHLGTWIAGNATRAADMPTTGTATYGGHAIGEVFNGETLYLATGDFTHQWNFGTARGTVDMTFDETDYTGATEIRSSSAEFTGRLEAPGRVMGMFGNFVTGGADTVAAEIGRFSIANTEGSTYRASGTFGGERTGN